VLIYFFGTLPLREDSPPGTQNVAVRQPASSTEDIPEDVPVPTILVFEDHDSYSFIDLTADVPLVSFAKKDAYVPEYVVPMLPHAQLPLPFERGM
jgi:hypothetical protein